MEFSKNELKFWKFIWKSYTSIDKFSDQGGLKFCGDSPIFLMKMNEFRLWKFEKFWGIKKWLNLT